MHVVRRGSAHSALRMPLQLFVLLLLLSFVSQSTAFRQDHSGTAVKSNNQNNDGRQDIVDGKQQEQQQAPLMTGLGSVQGDTERDGQTQDTVQEDQATTKDERLGAAEFQEGWKLLQDIRPPRRRLARFTRPTSIFGSVLHYAREIFNLLFMNGPSFEKRSSIRKSSPILSKAIRLLESAAAEGHEDAIYTLAEVNFYGKHTHPRNYTAALNYYSELAQLEGNSTAQHMLGFMYATGIGGVVAQDQAKALLYHTFAADAGEIRAQMTTAYRHHSGIATPRDCEKAVHFYRQVADEAMAYARSGPPGGQQILKEAYRLADESGGVYGEGASVSSSGENAKRSGPTHDANAAFDDVLEYLDLMSRKGDLKAIFSLGRLHYEGSRALQRNYRIAADKFFDVARRYWDKNGKIRQDTEAGVDKLAAKAAGYLGRMFLRGEGLDQNFQIARVWFKRGIENGDALCQYSMGLIHLHGLGVPQSAVRAAEYFAAAADQDLSAAQVRLGALLMDQGDLAVAVKYFELAARHGHIEAFYYLAELADLGVGANTRNCNQAASYYKIVAEKAELVHSNFGEANDAYEDGDLDTALLYYMMAAEQGYEAGQANVAYILDRAIFQTSQVKRFISTRLPKLAALLPFFSVSPKRFDSTSVGDAVLALIYWTRSAKERNIDSLLKMGDYYLAGLGVTTPTIGGPGYAQEQNITENQSKAAACYVAASETYQSAQALFNLGWMHENGIGLEQDFHLAKRYYDQAAEPPMKEAKTPVTLALLKLRVRSWWNRITGGSINSIRELTPEEGGKGRRGRRTFWEWFSEFLAADLEQYDEDQRNGIGAAGGDRGSETGTGNYMDEWGRTIDRGYRGDDRGNAAAADDEEQWEEAFGDLVETLVIVGFAAILAGLVWYRQMVAMRQRTQAQQQYQLERAQAQAQQFAPAQSHGQNSQQQQQPLGTTGTGPSSTTSPNGLQPSTAEPRNVRESEISSTSQSSSSNTQPEPGRAENQPPFSGWGAGPGGIGH